MKKINLNISYLFIFFLAGVLLQSCEQQTITSTLSDETVALIGEESIEISEDIAEADAYIQEPYNDDPYFDYVQEYRYKGKVYTYADKGSDNYQELIDLLNREDISIAIVQDLDELTAYEQQYADIALEDRNQYLAPHYKIANVFDTEEASKVFLDVHGEQIDVIQGYDSTDIESRVCSGNTFELESTWYVDVNRRGRRIIYRTRSNRNSRVKINFPGSFNDKVSSYKLKVNRLPGGIADRVVVTVFEHYNTNGRGGSASVPRSCSVRTVNINDLRSSNFNDIASSWSTYLQRV